MRASRTRPIGGHLAFPLLFLACILAATLMAEELAAEVKGGLRLAVGTIIPSLFPFMILSDVIASVSSGGGARLFTRPVERLFGVGTVSARAFLVGSIAGAPIAASMLALARDEGLASDGEVARVLAISSSPSLAFAVSGVGAAMWDDVRLGLLLYLSVITASVIFGLLARGRGGHHTGGGDACPSFDLMATIERATFSSIRVIGVVTAFSVLSGLAARFSATAPFVIPLLEVGNAASYLSEYGLSPSTALALTAFALGFSGISVHLQVRSAIGKRVSDPRFLAAKIAIGLGSAVIFSLLRWLIT